MLFAHVLIISLAHTGLMDARKILATDKKRPKEERETLQQHYVFLQLAPKPEFDALISTLTGMKNKLKQ